MLKFFRKANDLIFRGFQLERPDLFIPWNITQRELMDLFFQKGLELKKVTNGYYTIDCISLKGLSHELGFHFQPRKSDNFKKLEFFRGSYPDINDSFNEFQKHFEKRFGTPSKSYPRNPEGFPAYEWNFSTIRTKIIIRHYVFDRFGLEEHMYVERLS